MLESLAPTRVEATFLTVSGQPPIAALKVYAGERCLMTVASREDVVLFSVGPSAANLTWGGIRCNRCHCWAQWAGGTKDNRLGFTGYCKGCVDALVGVCLERHARLPVQGQEFYCCGCGDICSTKEQPGDQSQQRLRCKACRKAQWQAARQRQGEKAKAKGSIRAA